MDYHHQQHEELGVGGGGSLSNSPSSSSDRNHQQQQQYHPRYNHNLNYNNHNNNSHNHNDNNYNNINNNNNNHNNQDPMQSWWETVSKTRTRIQALLSLLPTNFSSDSLSSLADSDQPARSLLDSPEAYSAVCSALSGSGDDPLCQWLYDTFQSSSSSENEKDDLRLVVLSFVPAVVGMYLTRIHSSSTVSPSPTSSSSPSLAGFEAVLLALYSSEVKSRSGKPLLVSVPSPAYLSHHPSLYHTVSTNPKSTHSPSSASYANGGINVGVMCPPLEPQVGIKSTKRASIVGVAFHCFYKHISHMPLWSKLDLCRFAASWAGDNCPCALSLDFDNGIDNADDDEDVVTLRLPPNAGNGDALSSPDCDNGATNGQIILADEMEARLQIQDNGQQQEQQQQQERKQESGRIPLPWELLQPVLRILGHCLLAPLSPEDIKDAAAIAARRLYARASHDLSPQALLATRSLVHLDNRARAAAMAAALANPSSNATTPTPRKPEVLLVSK